MKTNSCLYITACRSKSDRLLGVFLAGCTVFVIPLVIPIKNIDRPVIIVGQHPREQLGPSSPGIEKETDSDQLGLLPVLEEKEPNDQIIDANPIKLGTRVRGAIATHQDRDFFKFRTSGRTPNRTRVILRKLTPAGFWAYVDVYDHAERHIGGDFKYGDTPVTLAFESTPNSSYYISVKSDALQPRGPYELEVREEGEE